MTDWISETVADEAGFRTTLAATNLSRGGGGQDLAVFDNPAFGRVLMLGGAIQVTTGDEFVYHEMMAHVPLVTHGRAERVVIVGGGDGGLAREVLRHPVREVVLVEIDRAVIDLCRREIPEVSAGAFDDPRLEVVIADGAAWMETAAPADAILVDAPDPVGPGAALFTAAFHAACRRALRPGGVVAFQSGMPFLSPDRLAAHAASLRRAFPAVRFYLSTVPSYTGGPMAHGLAADRAETLAVSPAVIAERAQALGLTGRAWSPAVHAAAFALPPWVEAALG